MPTDCTAAALRCLVVDDDAAIRDLLAGYLARVTLANRAAGGLQARLWLPLAGEGSD